MKLEDFKKLKIPDKPGVYFFKKGTKILYIGKATSLKSRIKSYFGNDLIETRGPILVELVFQSDKIKWQETESVLEALILEAALIKKNQPKYNTREKSNKSFNYVCITKEALPKVLLIRERNLQNEKEGNKFQAKFGPFTHGSQLKEAMKIIRPIFPYIDTQSSKHDNYQFYKQLGLTPDLSTKDLELTYKKNISNLKLFFMGKKKDVVRNLKKEMSDFAKNREFERAQEIKKRIFALSHINDVALLKEESSNFLNPNYSFSRIEAYDIAHMSGRNMVGVMVALESGEVLKSSYRKFKIRTQENANDTGALREVLERRFAHIEWPYPGLVVIDGGIQQLNLAKTVVKNLNLSIPIVSVLKDERHNPKDILGDKETAIKLEKEILLANSEAHRFAINYHKKTRTKNFLT